MSFLSFFFFISLLISTPAHAYLDPGTGSIILQYIIAIIAFISVFFNNLKQYIYLIIQKVKNKLNKK